MSAVSNSDYQPLLPWAEFHTQRSFCVTSDQDWAPEWAVAFFLNWAAEQGARPHVFTTNVSAALQAAVDEGRATRGWHPYFGVGSTHGSTVREVIDHLAAVAPGATTFRTHRFEESSDALQALADAGFTVESQFPTRYSSGILPSIHACGLVRLPVWFEDDVWMRDADLGDALVAASIDTPGLKILNLHPVHIALNSPSFDWYDANRAAIYGSSDGVGLAYRGRGARVVAEEILGVSRTASRLTEFTAIADRALSLAAPLVG